MLATIGIQTSEPSRLLELSKDSLSQTAPVVNVLFRMKQKEAFAVRISVLGRIRPFQKIPP